MRSFLSNGAQAQSSVSPAKHDAEDAGQGQEATEHSGQHPQSLNRAATQPSMSQRQRSPVEPKPTNVAPVPANEPAGDPKQMVQRQWTEGNVPSTNKEKKKGVSFLSRILAPNKARHRGDLTTDEDHDEAADVRPEGMDAQLFSHSADNVGFSPRQPQPPGYIKVRSKFQKHPTFDRVFLAQELRTGRQKGPVPAAGAEETAQNGDSTPSATADPEKHGARRASGETGNDAIWAMEFSHDGRYLAAAGQDKVVRVWSVISSQEERRMHERDEEAADKGAGPSAQHLSAPVFRREPMRQYKGHSATVIDVSWSKNNFLLSSSFDKTVRLWHVSRDECLVTFKHAEYCPSIQFHPRDDRFFLAGSLDTKLRLWSIPDKSVAFWNQLPEIITAVAFTPDGKTAMAGTMGGSCLFYDTEGLKYRTQINVKPSGRNAKPAKITGIKAINWSDETAVGSGTNKDGGRHTPSPTNSLQRDVKLLISSNDSRIRLYNCRDKSLEMKFKAHRNMASQIRAHFSDDSRFVISGSEDRKTYIWSTGPSQDGERQRPLEVFEAHNTMTTGAIIAPRKTRIALSASEDPVFDICNPPPVTLISRSESVRTGSNASGALPNGGSTEINGNGSVQATPATAEGTFKRAEESPQYLARTAHPGGHIIVSADYAGNIKVFRQDCAHRKRKTDMWSDAASVFSRHSRRIGSVGGAGAGRIGRSLTGASRNSAAGSINSSRSRAGSTTTQPPGERILSWRQDISGSFSTSTGSLEGSSLALRARAVQGIRNRSASPRKSVGAMSASSSSALGKVDSGHSLRRDPSMPNTSTTSTSGLLSSSRLSSTAPSPTATWPGKAHPNGGGSFASSDANTPTAPVSTTPTGHTLQKVASPDQMSLSDLEALSAQRQAGDDPDDDEDGENPLWLRGGKSYVFWNASAHHGGGGGGGGNSGSRSSADVPPPVTTANGAGRREPRQLKRPSSTERASQGSVVSKLSSERRSTRTSNGGASDGGRGENDEDDDDDGGDDDDDNDDEEEEEEGRPADADGELVCHRCGSSSFRARVAWTQGHGGHQLVCQRCGAPA